MAWTARTEIGDDLAGEKVSHCQEAPQGRLMGRFRVTFIVLAIGANGFEDPASAKLSPK